MIARPLAVRLESMNGHLSFDSLEEQIRERMRDEPIINRSGRVWLLIGVLGALVALGSQYFAPVGWKIWIAFAGMCTELAGFVVYFIIELRQELPWFRDAKASFAKELESNYAKHLDIVAWLSKFPKAEIHSRLHYIKQRQDIMARRLALVTGSVDKLGLLPIVVAVYLQLRGSGWPPQVDFWNGFWAALLLATYAVCLWLVGLKLRLDLYVNMLASSAGE
jgi:hypothetical protein